jgi:hypothetical protein
MFTNFGKKFEKAKAKILNNTTPEFTETRILKRQTQRQEQLLVENSQLKKELLNELSRTTSTYLEGSETTSKEHEVILSTNAPEMNSGSLGGACGGSSLIKLKDDGFGVFKPYSDFELTDRKVQIQNERAAYLIDLFLGFDLVPPTVIRELTDLTDNTEQVGSMQQFIEKSSLGAELSNSGKNDVDPGEISKLAIFDFMIKNTDRHSSNYLIKDRKIFAIDHGLCFASTIARFRDEDETPESILSPHYYSMVHRAQLFDGSTFWDLELPEQNRKKLKAFYTSEKDQLIFRQLFKELVGDKKADLFIHRINSIIESIDEQGKLNQETLTEKLGRILEEKYSHTDNESIVI